MRDATMKEKLFALLRKQNPALAALCSAPTLSRKQADVALEEAYAVAPWSRDILAALEAGAPGTRDRYAAALAQETGEGRAAVLAQLTLEAAQACPF